eukprot:scpid60563/ scgid4321/ 
MTWSGCLHTHLVHRLLIWTLATLTFLQGVCGQGVCPPGTLLRQATSHCINVLAIDSVAYEQQQAQYDGVVFPLNITNPGAIATTHIGPRDTPVLSFTGSFGISIATPQSGVDLSSTWTLVATIDFPQATTTATTVILFYTNVGYVNYYVKKTVQGSTVKFDASLSMIDTSMNGVTSAIPLASSSSTMPEFGLLATALVYLEGPRTLRVLLHGSEIASRVVTIQPGTYFKGLGASSASDHVSRLLSVRLFNEELFQPEIVTMGNCALPASLSSCSACSGLVEQQNCLSPAEALCSPGFLQGDNFTCNTFTSCEVLGDRPAQDGTVLKGPKNAYAYTWILPMNTKKNCNVKIKGFEIYHSSTAQCDVRLSVWDKVAPGLKVNEYTQRFSTAKAQIPATATGPTLARYFFASTPSYTFPYTTTSYIGITTSTGACRLLGESSGSVGVQYANGFSGLPGNNNIRNLKTKVSMKLSLRLLLQDIDECSISTPCQSYTNNVCSNTFGSYSCVCKSGYSGTGGASGTCTYIPTTVPTTTPTTTPTTPTTTP